MDDHDTEVEVLGSFLAFRWVLCQQHRLSSSTLPVQVCSGRAKASHIRLLYFADRRIGS